MTDAAILAWVIRTHSSWIERSPVTYSEAAAFARIALEEARLAGLAGKSAQRHVASSLIGLLKGAGPSRV